MVRKKKENKVLMARNTIIGFITAVAIAILVFGTYVSTGLVDAGDIVLGEDFVELDNPPPHRPGDKIEVVEYFSYTCVHCKTFDPEIEEWAAEQESDVEFRRQPASFTPIAAVLAQTYFALEEAGALEQNHTRIFRAIHDNGRQFLTPEMVADFVDGRGITRDEFLQAFNAPDVRRAMRRAEREQRIYQVSATPSMIVADRYVVGLRGGQRRAKAVLDHVIELVRAGGEPASG